MIFIIALFIGITSCIYFTYYMYTLVVCQNMCYLPMVCQFCPNPTPGPIILSNVYIPPINIVAQKTARLVDDLTNTDVSAPHRFVAIQTLLTEIQTRVDVSTIDERVKEQLKTHLPALDSLIEKEIDDLITMQITLGSCIDNIKIYTEYTLDDFSRILNGGNPRFGSERIGK
jgi:hypothetical protein